MKVAVSVTASWMLMTLCTHVHADNTGNPAGMSPDTPGIENARPAPDYANTQDKLFVRQAALGGRAEVELGKLAQSRAESASVKALGEKMAADHGKANDRLTRLGKNINAQVPASLDPDDEAFRSELQRESGRAFDERYLAKQIGDHQRTVNLLQWQISFGQNEPLKHYAKEMLPIVSEHLRTAQAAMAALTGSAPPR